jgi:DNA polymerase-3 subunit alpha
LVARYSGEEPITYLDPILEPILKDSFALCIYQEAIQKIFEVVGGMTPLESDDARRAIGKKDLKLINEQKGKLFEGAKKLGWSLDKSEALWNSFIGAANYAFNKCLKAGTLVHTKAGPMTIETITPAEMVLTENEVTGAFEYKDVEAMVANGEREIFEVELENGRIFACTMEHRFKCSDGIWRDLRTIITESRDIVCYNFN